MDFPLSPPRIASLCRSAARQVAIEVVSQTGSTNTDLLERTGSLVAPTLLLAELQTGGRGRAGRAWHSVSGASLTFSLAWPFGRSVRELAGLTLAVGVAIVRALRAFGVRTELKWPNDVLKNGSKLAGVLIETAHAGERLWAVIGVGLNLTLPDELESQIGQPAADAPWLAQLDRNTLMAGLLSELSEVLTEFDAQGFAPFLSEWNRMHAHAGKLVAMLDGGRIMHQGTVAGVDGNGRLLLDTASGRIAVAAGDVSLRVKE